MRRDKGAALIVAMVAIIAIAGMATALINMAAMRSKGVNDRLDQFRAFQAAQSAVARVMTRMAAIAAEDRETELPKISFGDQFITDKRLGDLALLSGGTGGTKEMLGEAEYFAIVGAVGDGTYKIVAAGRLGDIERVIEVIVKPPTSNDLPGPFPLSGAESGGAIGLFGPVGMKAKLKLPGNLVDPADLEPGEVNDDSGDSLVTISGIDKSAQGADTLGLGIGDTDSFKKLVDDITKKMADGKIPEGLFDGDPDAMVTYDVNGTEVTTSIGQSEGSMDGDTITAYADAVAETVRGMVEEAKLGAEGYTYIDDTTYKKGEILEDIVWGTSADSITIIDAKKLKINKKSSGDDATVSGEGTLIILGQLDIHHADFNWDGDIIILGDTRDAKLQNHHATLNVDGTIVLLGSGKKGKASLTIQNDKKTDDSTSTINGGVLLLSGADDKKAKVEFKVKHGSLDMRGLLMMLGHQVKVELSPEHGKKKGDAGHFTMDGNMILGVTELVTDGKKKKKSKLDIKIKGNVAIQHDSDAVDDALGLFKKFFKKFAPDVPPPPASGSYDVVVWREK